MEAFRQTSIGPYEPASRLTKLYTDTKQSYKATTLLTKVSDNEPPEVLSLHRKIRLQKDRLISWGLAWCDDDNDGAAQGNIDASLERSGLSEIVASVMENIKTCLDESESIRVKPAVPVTSPTGFPVEKGSPMGRVQGPWTQAEKAHYKDLVSDLTTAIDLLCELSNSRRPQEKGLSKVEKAGYPINHAKSADPIYADCISDEPLHQHGAIPKIMIDQLILPEEGPPAYDNFGVSRSTRVFGCLQNSGSRVLGESDGEGSPLPVLVEYATFDSIYKDNNVPVPLTRLEQLHTLLHQARARGQETLPRLIGYFEDARQPRYGLVYDLPAAVWESDPAMNGFYNTPAPATLFDLLQTASRLHSNPSTSASVILPPLEQRFSLARELVAGFSFLHDQSFTHRDFSSSGIALMPRTSGATSSQPPYDISRPLICSFDLFSEYLIDAPTTCVRQNIYRHPDDPAVKRTSASERYDPKFDLYSLGLVLLEVGLWLPLEDIFKEKYSLHDFKTRVEKIWVRKLAGKCGSLYMRTVQDCLNAGSDTSIDGARVAGVYARVRDAMLRCCLVCDPNAELNQVARKVEKTAPRQEVEDVPPPLASTPSAGEIGPHKVSKPPRYIFPDMKIPKLAREQWRSSVAQRVANIVTNALWDKDETWEVVLYCAGENEAVARPTISVACTSVKLVRMALRRHLRLQGDVFDVAVSKGEVVRSKATKREGAAVQRSAGPYKELKARNPDHHLRATCGASIGAWRNEQHLPPVSLGGVVLVDGETFGMSVHHMVEDPDDHVGNHDNDDSASSSDVGDVQISSSGQRQILMVEDDDSDSDSDDDTILGSDDELDWGASILQRPISTSLPSGSSPGDLPGIPPSSPSPTSSTITITQPALDDIPPSFFPVPSDRDEDHLDSHTLGHIHATSGLRRCTANGILHEVDWALLRLKPSRLQPLNLVAGGRRHCLAPASATSSTSASFSAAAAATAKAKLLLRDPVSRGRYLAAEDLYPTSIASSSDLPGLKVHCSGRTSGLSTGTISEDMVPVCFPGRKTPSMAYVVKGGRIGVPGDSGAWVVESGGAGAGAAGGRVCGYILAWSRSFGHAYMAPMDVMLEDVRRTLGAGTVCLPGGEEAFSSSGQHRGQVVPPLTEGMARLGVGVGGGVSALLKQKQVFKAATSAGISAATTAAAASSTNPGGAGSSGSKRLEREWAVKGTPALLAQEQTASG